MAICESRSAVTDGVPKQTDFLPEFGGSRALVVAALPRRTR
jgi:hypothetical protein